MCTLSVLMNSLKILTLSTSSEIESNRASDVNRERTYIVEPPLKETPNKGQDSEHQNVTFL